MSQVQPSSDAALLAEIETFCRDHEISPTAFGEEAIGDRRLVGSLREGRSVTLRTADQIRAFMAKRSGRKAKAAAS
jgi:hypothetical protein